MPKSVWTIKLILAFIWLKLLDLKKNILEEKYTLQLESPGFIFKTQSCI